MYKPLTGRPNLSKASTIACLPHHQIDKRKWDDCITHASNGLIYPYSFYLDSMTGNWDGLVLNDYEAVMPLPWRKKWGIYYLYQPPFAAQLGLFGNEINSALLESFLNSVPKKFSYWDCSLNHSNNFQLNAYHLHQRSNFVLNLQSPYETIYSGYRENIKRNIKKAASYNCTVQKNVPVDQIISLAKGQSGAVNNNDFIRFENLFHDLSRKGVAKTYGMLSSTGQLLSSAVFFFSHNRAYYILVGNHPNGRTLGASHAVIDAFIQEGAGQNLLLDFEGSDIPNLAFFYSSFGAAEEKYAAIHLNRLPLYVKWLKK